MNSIEMTAKTTEDAISQGLEKLGVGISDVRVEILEEGSKGLFGLFGSRPAKVRLTLIEEETEDDVREIFSSAQTPKEEKPEKPEAPVKAEPKKPAPKAEKPAQEKKPRQKEPSVKAEKPAKAERTAKAEKQEYSKLKKLRWTLLTNGQKLTSDKTEHLQSIVQSRQREPYTCIGEICCAKRSTHTRSCSSCYVSNQYRKAGRVQQ